MKKAILILLTIILCFPCGLTACKTPESVSVYAPDGAPLIPIAKMMTDGEKIGGRAVNYEKVAGTQIAALLTNKQADIALAPINVCAIAYNNQSGYVLAGVAVWGINYVLSRDGSITSLADLKGGTIYAYQRAGTPGITLRAAIKLSGLDYVENADSVPEDKVGITYLASPAACKTALSTGTIEAGSITVKAALIAEPHASEMEAGNASIIRIADLQEIWKGEHGFDYPQVGVAVKKSLIDTDPAFVDEFLQKLAASAEYALANGDETAALIVNDIESAELTESALKSYLASQAGALNFAGADYYTAVDAYLTELYAADNTDEKTLIGGKVPDEAFYYKK